MWGDDGSLENGIASSQVDVSAKNRERAKLIEATLSLTVCAGLLMTRWTVKRSEAERTGIGTAGPRDGQVSKYNSEANRTIPSPDAATIAVLRGHFDVETKRILEMPCGRMLVSNKILFHRQRNVNVLSINALRQSCVLQRHAEVIRRVR